MLFCISRIIPDRMFFSALSFEKDVLIANGSKSSLFRECKQAKGQIFSKKNVPQKTFLFCPEYVWSAYYAINLLTGSCAQKDIIWVEERVKIVHFSKAGFIILFYHLQ